MDPRSVRRAGAVAPVREVVTIGGLWTTVISAAVLIP